MHPALKFPTLSSAVRTAAQQLAMMPASPQVDALATVVRHVESEVAGWETHPPRPDQHQWMTQTVLGIHFVLASLTKSRSRGRHRR
jgi:hypothetical protein